ncbi:MAG: hypothetical protein ALECFALPRED_010965 [Alectoria fallacina]|uniref:Uncharacterized protein n=1 Tax=Alectoria fallacina TaxID=1903189 RepID=A0A8H3IIP9_9LECA|nr:MAG: hypothetical protein ALECFALPRED_010965 [Alectoria fallacina]
MENTAADWNDFLDSEVISDIPSTDFGLQGREAGQQTFLPDFEQAQESQSGHRTFSLDWSNLGILSSAN